MHLVIARPWRQLARDRRQQSRAQVPRCLCPHRSSVPGVRLAPTGLRPTLSYEPGSGRDAVNKLALMCGPAQHSPDLTASRLASPGVRWDRFLPRDWRLADATGLLCPQCPVPALARRPGVGTSRRSSENREVLGSGEPGRARRWSAWRETCHAATRPRTSLPSRFHGRCRTPGRCSLNR